VVIWRDPTGGDWEITPHWAEVDGRAAIVGLDVRSFREFGSDGDRRPVGDKLAEVTQRVLRGLPFASAREETRTRLLHESAALADYFTVDHDDGLGSVIQAERTKTLTTRGEPRKRVPAASVDLLSEVARIYLAATASGDKTPAKFVEDRLREAGVPISERGGRAQVRKWIQRARERGLIPPTR
jgi:hypothetical protein